MKTNPATRKLPFWRYLLAPLAGMAGAYAVCFSFAWLLMAVRGGRSLSEAEFIYIVLPAYFLLAMAGSFAGAALAPRRFMGFVQGVLLAGLFLLQSPSVFHYPEWVLLLLSIAAPVPAYFWLERLRRRRAGREAVFQFEEEGAETNRFER